MTVLKVFGELLGAAIGAVCLWLFVPAIIFFMSLAGAFFEMYGMFVAAAFPVFAVLWVWNCLRQRRH